MAGRERRADVCACDACPASTRSARPKLRSPCKLTLPPSLLSSPPQGTASTEAMELSEAYGLSVVTVPPHRPSRRVDHAMRCFAFEQARTRSVGLCLCAGSCDARGGARCCFPPLVPHNKHARTHACAPANLPACPPPPTPTPMRAQGKRLVALQLLLDALDARRPVLVGTGSVEESEEVLKFLEGVNLG